MNPTFGDLVEFQLDNTVVDGYVIGSTYFRDRLVVFVATRAIDVALVMAASACTPVSAGHHDMALRLQAKLLGEL